MGTGLPPLVPVGVCFAASSCHSQRCQPYIYVPISLVSIRITPYSSVCFPTKQLSSFLFPNARLSMVKVAAGVKTTCKCPKSKSCLFHAIMTCIAGMLLRGEMAQSLTSLCFVNGDRFDTVGGRCNACPTCQHLLFKPNFLVPGQKAVRRAQEDLTIRDVHDVGMYELLLGMGDILNRIGIRSLETTPSKSPT
jgi:hypothetical protein